MKKEKWTCWIDEEKKAEGAIVGGRKAVLDWMKKTYPGLRKTRDGEVVPAWFFFWENDAEHYRSAKGEDLYLVRGPAEEERKAPTAEEEKRLEKALRSHRGNRIKYDREGFEAERKDEGEKARRGKVSDDEVADEVAKAILKTACLQAREQAEKLEQVKGRDYVFAWMLCTDDMWPIVDIVNRLLHDEVAAREYLCDTFYREGKVESKVLCSRIRSGKFIHFQMTRAFNGGMDAYIVFRTPKTRSAVIIRFCYK